MKKLLILLCWVHAATATVSFNVSSGKNKKMGLVIGVVTAYNDPELIEVVNTIQRDCTFTQQFALSVQNYKTIPDKKTITSLYKKNIKGVSSAPALALFLQHEGDAYEWRVFDTMTGIMIAGKKYHKKGTVPRSWGHAIADAVWPVLTGKPGIFSTKIVFCKRIKCSDEKSIKHIYVADYDGSYEQLLVDTNTINVAPRWNQDQSKPLVFYSSYTNQNVRLMVSDLHKKQRVASNFDGINMLPAFSADGKKLVYCVSRGDGNCQLYYCEHGVFKRLTSNMGHNICPTLSADGNTLFFSSDFKSGKPQIVSYDLKTNAMDFITEDGFAVCPRYHEATKQLAYCKIVDGVMQLFVYNTLTKQHRQLTFDSSNKEECSWSVCGNYLLYAVESSNTSRLAMLTLSNGIQRFITSPSADCTYPDWSPVYRIYPEIT